MLSRRLTLKLEALTDEARAHLEEQADLLLTMPQQCRDHRHAGLRLIPRPVPAPCRRPHPRFFGGGIERRSQRR
jgi:hypothetical protein